MTTLSPSNGTQPPVQKPKVLRVSSELAPVSDNPGLFFIGWTRPLADADFRQLRRCMLVDFLARPKATRLDPAAARRGVASAPVFKKAVDCSLAPILVKFLRPEGAIMGADLREYGPFLAGEVAPVPYAHACVFIANGAAEIYG